MVMQLIAYLLRHYDTNRMVAGSMPDEVNFYIYLILPSAVALGFIQPLTEMSTRSIKIIMFLVNKVRRVHRADNFTAISEPIV
jgi:hypothetical protein